MSTPSSTAATRGSSEGPDETLDIRASGAQIFQEGPNDVCYRVCQVMSSGASIRVRATDISNKFPGMEVSEVYIQDRKDNRITIALWEAARTAKAGDVCTLAFRRLTGTNTPWEMEFLRGDKTKG